jgi:predicted Zn-dependent protease
MTAQSHSRVPRSLLEPDAPPRYPSRDECEALYRRILSLTSGGGETTAWIVGSWNGNLRWARNRITTTGDIRDVSVRVGRLIRGAPADITTNKLDDASLKRAIESAEAVALYRGENPDVDPLPGPQQYVTTHTWSDATYGVSEQARSDLARQLVDAPSRAGLQAAGYLEVGVSVRAVFNTSGMSAYQAITRASYSVTVRNKAGTGSGWAGMSHYDWSRIDPFALTARSSDKCVKSADPRAVEPGHYTVILEPQAVADLLYSMVSVLDRPSAETMMTPYTLRPGQSKIGVKMFDERVTIGTDPADPSGGYIAFDWDGFPYRAVQWIKDGVLKELAYNRAYALEQLGTGAPQPNPMAYRMAGGTASMDEMIASTDRGLLVTRFSNVSVLDGQSLLSTGVTRDGVWLIERGAIKLPVKNLRFTDSPLFALNKIEQLGVPQQVFSPYYPVEVPPLKVRDFNFTALADAV